MDTIRLCLCGCTLSNTSMHVLCSLLGAHRNAAMSIANTAAQAMLSDALVRDTGSDIRLRHLDLELPLDRFIKFVSVGLPLLLVSMAFAREISLGQCS